MSGRYDAKIGDNIVLEASFAIGGVPTDVEISKVELVNNSLVAIDTIEGIDVVWLETGKYMVTFAEVSQSGQLSDHWTYRSTPNSELQTAVLSVYVTGVDTEPGEGPDPTPPPDPDIGLGGVCKVTHRFLDAGGNGWAGVYVRFRPEIFNDAVTPWGTIARDVDAVTDTDGNLEIYLVRGVKGTLAISGVGLVRTVTVPDVATCPLYDLIADSTDLFEVQNLDDFIDLPKES